MRLTRSVCPQAAEERNHDLASLYRAHFTRNVNPSNLAHYMDAYTRRQDLGIARDAATIRVPVLNITGAMSPHVDDTVTFNGRLNPNNSTWMKVSSPQVADRSAELPNGAVATPLQQDIGTSDKLGRWYLSRLVSFFSYIKTISGPQFVTSQPQNLHERKLIMQSIVRSSAESLALQYSVTSPVQNRLSRIALSLSICPGLWILPLTKSYQAFSSIP